jgi:lipopolysaccharide transport system permease protein
MVATLVQYRELLYVLIYRDLKSRTKQAFLAYFWIVAQPLIATGVFTVLVQLVLGLRFTVDVPYPVFVLSGMLIWQYFANSLQASTESLTQHLDLVTQVYFPKEILVLYPVAAKLVDVGLGLGLLALFMAIYRIPASWQLLWLPGLVLLTGLLAFSLGLLLAPLQAGFRDTSKLLIVLLGFAIYAAPVVYPVSAVPAWLQPWYSLNPMAAIVAAVHRVVLEGQTPDLGALSLATAVTLLLFALAERAFRLFETMLADVI